MKKTIVGFSHNFAGCPVAKAYVLLFYNPLAKANGNKFPLINIISKSP